MKKTFLLLVFISTAFNGIASHLRGGEMYWECAQDSNSGKFIFYLDIYWGCSICNIGGQSMINPLYANNGGPATIYLNRYAIEWTWARKMQNCYDTSMWFDCTYNTPGYYYNIAKNRFKSTAVQIVGTPSVTGSDFYFNSCCRHTTNANINGSGVYYRTTMYPYTAPGTTTPMSLGDTINGPGCYDHSPRFAESPDFVYCKAQNSTIVNTSIDLDGDSLTYEWSTPKTSANLLATWRLGYNQNNPLPDQSENTSNVGAVLDTSSGVISFNTVSPLSPFFTIVVKVSSYRNGQKIAEIYRDVSIRYLDCDSLSGGGSIKNTGVPEITLKDANASVYQKNFSATYPVGSTIELDLRSVDVGLLPTTPPTLQSVDLHVSGMTMSGTLNDSTDCRFAPCAYLDSTRSNWNGVEIRNTSAVTAKFVWNTACENLNIIGPNGKTASRTYQFVVQSNDDFCPVPGTGYNVFYITLVDTSNGGGWPYTTMDATHGGVRVFWPQFTGTGFSSYDVYRSYDPNSTGILISSITNRTSTFYIDNSARSDSTPVYYHIKVENSWGCSDAFEKRTIHVRADTISKGVRLLWNNPHLSGVSNGKYYVKRFDTLGYWRIIDSLSYNFESYFDNSTPVNTPLAYHIESNDLTGLRTLSNVDSALIYEHVDNPIDTTGNDTTNTDTTDVSVHRYQLEKEIRIYPNPVERHLFVNIKGKSNSKLEIFNTDGKLEMKSRLIDGLNRIDISGLESGLFMVRIQNASNEVIFTGRIVKRE